MYDISFSKQRYLFVCGQPFDIHIFVVEAAVGPAVGTLGLAPAAAAEGPAAMEPAEGPVVARPTAIGPAVEGLAVERLGPWRTRGLKE